MTNEELISEFKRWLNTNKPKVYVRSISNFEKDKWKFTYIPSWTPNTYYIVNDEHAAFRCRIIDLEIEYKNLKEKLCNY